MYTEIIKIIEGGLVNDKEKVFNYANVLANNLEQQGELSLAKRIRTTLNKKNTTFTSLESLSTKPYLNLEFMCQIHYCFMALLDVEKQQ